MFLPQHRATGGGGGEGHVRKYLCGSCLARWAQAESLACEGLQEEQVKTDPRGRGAAGGLEGIGRGQGFRQAAEEGMESFQAEGAAWVMTQHLRASSNGQGRPEHLGQVLGVAGGRRKKKEREGEGKEKGKEGVMEKGKEGRREQGREDEYGKHLSPAFAPKPHL